MKGLITMNENKLEWTQPELQELNFGNTQSGHIYYPDESATSLGPVS